MSYHSQLKRLVLRSRQSKPVLYVFPVEQNQHVLQHVCTSSLTLGIARFYNTFSYTENWATINQLGQLGYIKESHILRRYDIIALKLPLDARNTK